jgi:hypothetical protein
MKHAMSYNDFIFFSREIRKITKLNWRLILLGRPDALISGEERVRLTGRHITISNLNLPIDDAPDFENLRLSFFDRSEYKQLIRGFLQFGCRTPLNETVAKARIANLEDEKLDDLLKRPVQAKMLAELLEDPGFDPAQVSRFALYDAFITKMLLREEEKNARVHISSLQRRRFMRELAW